MEWIGMATPCMLVGTREMRFGQAFTIKAEVKCDVIGGKQVVISKRVPVSHGNRPGVILLLHGSCVELMSFEDGGDSWITARTYSKVIKVGHKHEILAFREGKEARIYVNGIDQTNPKYDKIHAGDLNCDCDAFAGAQVYDKVAAQEPFKGRIFMIGAYEESYTQDARYIRLRRNPNVVPLSQLPELAERIGMPRR